MGFLKIIFYFEYVVVLFAFILFTTYVCLVPTETRIRHWIPWNLQTVVNKQVDAEI